MKPLSISDRLSSTLWNCSPHFSGKQPRTQPPPMTSSSRTCEPGATGKKAKSRTRAREACNSSERCGRGGNSAKTVLKSPSNDKKPADVNHQIRALRTELNALKNPDRPVTARIPSRINSKTQWWCHGCGKTYSRDGRPIPCEAACVYEEHAEHDTGYRKGIPYPAGDALSWGPSAEAYKRKVRQGYAPFRRKIPGAQAPQTRFPANANANARLNLNSDGPRPPRTIPIPCVLSGRTTSKLTTARELHARGRPQSETKQHNTYVNLHERRTHTTQGG